MRYDESVLDHYEAKVESELSQYLSDNGKRIAVFKLSAFLHLNVNDAQVLRAYVERHLDELARSDGARRQSWVDDLKDYGVVVPEGNLSYLQIASIEKEALSKMNGHNGKAGNGQA